MFETPAGVDLVVTPNLDHIRLLGQPAFGAAYRSAHTVCPDGFPVLAYARMRGLKLRRRVTGCEIYARLADDPRLRTKSMCVVVEIAENGCVAASLGSAAEPRGLPYRHRAAAAGERCGGADNARLCDRASRTRNPRHDAWRACQRSFRAHTSRAAARLLGLVRRPGSARASRPGRTAPRDLAKTGIGMGVAHPGKSQDAWRAAMQGRWPGSQSR